MGDLTLDPMKWAAEQFGDCDLGDVRRTRRAVKLAAQIARAPSASTPVQTENWSDCKAAYNLLDNEDVTFESLAEPHWQRTRARSGGHWLLLGDTTELEFGIHRKIEGLGPTGDGGGRGFFLHSSLMISADTEELVGLAGQAIYHRRPAPQKESRYERGQRERESRIWGQVIDQVGRPPEGVRFTHVFDRGADNFEVFCRLLQQSNDWVVRAAQLRRKVLAPDGESMELQDYLTTLPVLGSYQLEVRVQKDQPARTAQLEVKCGLVTILRPQFRSPWLKACGIVSISMWVVEAREVNAATGVTPLRWVLYTSHAAEGFERAWCVIEYYEKRPLIEEFHKGLKTGCRTEQRQYKTSDRLEALAGMMSVVAVRLLQLRSVARTDPERPAHEIVPPRWIEVLAQLRKKTSSGWTVRRFYRELAGLGGFLGRKADGEPGWITLWRGFEKLAMVLHYEDLQRRKCG